MNICIDKNGIKIDCLTPSSKIPFGISLQPHPLVTRKKYKVLLKLPCINKK